MGGEKGPSLDKSDFGSLFVQPHGGVRDGADSQSLFWQPTSPPPEITQGHLARLAMTTWREPKLLEIGPEAL